MLAVLLGTRTNYLGERQAVKMFLSITLLLVVMVAYVQGAGQCCVPLQYEAFQGKMTSHMKNGKFSTKFGTTLLIWDGVANKTYLREDEIEDGIPSRTVTIKDYPKKMMYELSGGLCKATALTTPFHQPCVSPTAQVMTHAVFGSNNALPITIYNSTTSAGSTFILTQTGSCYPVLDVTVQTNPPSTELVVFMNVTAGPPSDATLFNVPSSCSGPNPVGK